MTPLTKDELKRMNEEQHEDFVLINVLPPDAFNKAHIRTSVNVPVDDAGFVERVEKVAGRKDRKVVVYCASFDCDASEQATDKLEAGGFTAVYDYEGGTQDWFEQRETA